ncbi:MAG: N-6 DNA methylase [Planctomycetes bacterium]|nr:N-6 DNA methylase [Planctomycetota bacterium]
MIDEFEYDHSERLGDAFEYLLSVLGSQGDAGQFRTPRHIIDFIVSIVDPKKTETVLDPACGTAGFLISSYKHIVRANKDGSGNSVLTPEDSARLAANFKGYDISPDMVRLSLVNMYLHGFTDPHIVEYDTLTSLDRWNEHADVILANPPFMSPKGGIKPHNRFSVQSKRSEVLFVDYMAEHLTPNGRAGIIVPEGIIFQSQTAYTQLRKMLVEEYLVAVVSLPAGVFNPYSGVKTSILILDKALAKQTDRIAFFKVENDGFGLGAQRREIDKNDLPQARAEIAEYLRRLRARESVEDFQPTLGLIVPKEKIAANGDYNLSGERYRENGQRASRFPHVRLDAIAEIAAGNSAPQGDHYFKGGESPFVRTSDVGAVHLSASFIGSADKVNHKAIEELRLRLFPEGTILFPKSGASTFLNHRVVMGEPAYVSSHLACIICDEAKALPKYVYSLLCRVDARQITPDQAYPSLRLTEIGSIEIPLPPLDVQKEIVAEIEGYQKVIDGARAVLDNYRPRIPIHPDWPMVELAEVARFQEGPGILAKDFRKEGVPLVRLAGLGGSTVTLEGCNYLDSEMVAEKWNHFRLRVGDILVSTSASFGRPAIVTSAAEGAVFYTGLIRFQPLSASLDPKYLETFLGSPAFLDQAESLATGSSIRHFGPVHLKQMRIHLPPLATQEAIVADIEAEQALVTGNRELIARMEKKIQATLARVWGEDEPSPAEA